MEKYRKTRSRVLQENSSFFRQINVFTKEVNKELISRKFFTRDRFLQHFSTLCSMEKYYKTVMLKRYHAQTKLFREIISLVYLLQ